MYVPYVTVRNFDNQRDVKTLNSKILDPVQI